jgi:hypothetical protein
MPSFDKLSQEHLQALQRPLLRAAARRKLLPFIKYLFPDYQVTRHSEKLAEALEGVASGTIKRLIISMPPRHGKSLTASVYFPAWYLGLHPERAEVPDGLPAARKRLYVEGPTAQAAIDGLMAALHKTVGRAAFPIAVRVHQERYVCVLCPSDTYFSDREEARAHAKQHAVGPVRWVELVGVGRP